MIRCAKELPDMTIAYGIETLKMILLTVVLSLKIHLLVILIVIMRPEHLNSRKLNNNYYVMHSGTH